MASCSLGGPLNLNFSKSDFKKARPSDLCQLYGRKTWIRQEPLQFAGLMVSWKSPNTLTVGCAPSSDAKTAKKLEDGLGEEKSTPVKSQITPNWFEVQSLLTAICDTASIAEFELKLGGFRLYVSRDLAWKSHFSPPPSFPASVNTSVEVPESNGSVSTTSLAISKPVPSIGVTKAFLEKATDEGLVILQSPRVGYFRRSRTIKKKRAPPACKEKQLVKEGQVLCYIEQLGGEIPVESDVSGEVIKILRDDGEPVGYGDALIAILPSFPGIKKLQ